MVNALMEEEKQPETTSFCIGCRGEKELDYKIQTQDANTIKDTEDERRKI
jgi:hypothetical protein